MANVQRTVNTFVEPNAIAPSIQKRKSIADQSAGIKKQCSSGLDYGGNENIHDSHGSHRGRGAPEPNTQVKSATSQVQ